MHGETKTVVETLSLEHLRPPHVVKHAVRYSDGSAVFQLWTSEELTSIYAEMEGNDKKSASEKRSG
jgi:hypothetical protein